MQLKYCSNNKVNNAKKQFSLLTFTSLLSLCSTFSFAENLGQFGPTYPIEETAFSDKKVSEASGKIWRQYQQKALKNIQKSQQFAAKSIMDLPSIGLPQATQSRTYYHEPRTVLKQDLTTPDGRVLYLKGTEFNPLDTIEYQKTLVFFNGANQGQRIWAFELIKSIPENEQDDYYFITTSGKIFEMMSETGVALYYDQHGFMSKQFKIQAIPAIVNAKGKKLEIREILVDEDGNEI